MSLYTIKGDTLTEIADAIRTKTGRTDKLSPADFADAIRTIQSAVRRVRVEYLKTIPFERIDELWARNTFDLSPDGNYLLASGGVVYDVESGEVAWQAKDDTGTAVTNVYGFDYRGAVVGERVNPNNAGEREFFRATETSFEVIGTTSSAYAVWVRALSPYDDGMVFGLIDPTDSSNWVRHSKIYSDGVWFDDTCPEIGTWNGFAFTNDGANIVAYVDKVQKISRSTGEFIDTEWDPPGTLTNLTLTANNNYVVCTDGTDGAGKTCPILSVYRITDYQYLFDFDRFITEEGDGICLPRTNIVLFAPESNTNIRMFDIASGTPVEIENIPELSDTLGTIWFVKSNATGNRVMIIGSTGVDIWKVIEE